MFSTNNVQKTYSDKFYKPYLKKPSHIMFSITRDGGQVPELRSSWPEVSVKDVFRNFAKFSGKHLRQSFFLYSFFYTAFKFNS